MACLQILPDRVLKCLHKPEIVYAHHVGEEFAGELVRQDVDDASVETNGAETFPVEEAVEHPQTLHFQLWPFS